VAVGVSWNLPYPTAEAVVRTENCNFVGLQTISGKYPAALFACVAFEALN